METVTESPEQLQKESWELHGNSSKLQLAFEQHRFEQEKSTYMQIFSIDRYCTVNVFSLLQDFLNNILFSLVDFIVRLQYIIHIKYKICIN